MSTFVSRAFHLTSDSCFVSGQSEAIHGLNAIVGEIARTDIPVLLIGESGSGKEAYARVIHRLSAQSHLPLKKVSCRAVEPGEFLAQLKSHLRDEKAGGQDGPGALFLDGIDELDLACQKVLLSLLPEEETAEICGKRLRLISSAARDLDKEVESGRFRRELYFRINGVCLRLPPLRERKEDIPVLIEYFLAKHSTEVKRKTPVLGEEEVELLASHHWPGNIRELGNLAKKIVALRDSKMAIQDLRTAPRLPTRVQEELQTSSLKVASRAASRQAERELILKALDRTHWNRKRAAQELQISYKSLLYKIKQAGVEGTKPDDR